jgi:hypothetical protein
MVFSASSPAYSRIPTETLPRTPPASLKSKPENPRKAKSPQRRRALLPSFFRSWRKRRSVNLNPKERKSLRLVPWRRRAASLGERLRGGPGVDGDGCSGGGGGLEDEDGGASCAEEDPFKTPPRTPMSSRTTGSLGSGTGGSGPPVSPVSAKSHSSSRGGSTGCRWRRVGLRSRMKVV